MKKTLTVQCGNVSIGDKTVGIAIKFSRDSMPVTSADDLICGRRMSVSLKRGNADPDQESIDEVADNFAELEGVVEVKSYRVTQKNFAFTACFMLADIHPERLYEFAKRECTLQVLKSDEIPAKSRQPKANTKPLPFTTDATETVESAPTSLGKAVAGIAGKLAEDRKAKAEKKPYTQADKKPAKKAASPAKKSPAKKSPAKKSAK